MLGLRVVHQQNYYKDKSRGRDGQGMERDWIVVVSSGLILYLSEIRAMKERQ